MYLENNTINKFKRNDTLGNVIYNMYMPDKRLISIIPKYFLQTDKTNNTVGKWTKDMKCKSKWSLNNGSLRNTNLKNT